MEVVGGAVVSVVVGAVVVSSVLVAVDVVGSVEVELEVVVLTELVVVESVVDVVSSSPSPPARAITAMSRPTTAAMSRPIATF